MKKTKASIRSTAPFGKPHRDIRNVKIWPSSAGLLVCAVQVAEEAHRGQFRKDGKTPYITHPMAVADSLLDADDKIVALLHDVVEDTKLTVRDLKKNFPAWICDAVGTLTHWSMESYLDYILRVKKYPITRRVKMADLRHNMKTAEGHQLGKYRLALYILEAADLPPYMTVRMEPCRQCGYLFNPTATVIIKEKKNRG